MSNNWERVRLGDICEIIGGGTPKTSADEYWGVGVPWITPKDLSGYDYKYIAKGERSITEIGFKNSSARKLPKGTVLFTSRAPIGYVAIAENEVTTNQGFKSLICDESKCYNEYIYYCLKLNVKNIEAIASGSTFKEISGKALSGFEINLPPLETQEKIANILSSLDDKIENNKKTAEKLEEIAQTLFNRWFVEFNFPDENGLPYKDNGGEMVESEHGLIPKGWEVKRVEEVTKIIRGASPRPIQEFMCDDGIPWVKISDATASSTRFLFSTKEFIKEEGRNKSREVHVGTLILSNSATPGIPKIMKIDACVHDGWLIFNDFEEITKEYMFHFLIKNREEILSRSNGSVFRNLKTDILKNFKIVVPNSEIIKQSDEFFKGISQAIDFTENQTLQLEKTRDTILPKLMSGEMEV